MELTINTAALAAAVATVSRGVSARPSQAALGAIRLAATAGQVTLTAYDGESLFEATAPATITTPGTVLVPGVFFTAMTRQLAGDSVKLTLGRATLDLSCGTVQVGFPILDLADYPNLPASPDASGTIGSDLFAEAVASVAGAAERDSAAGTPLSVVELKLQGNQLTLTATDKYRLAWRTIVWHPTTPGIDRTVVLAVRSLAEAARIAALGSELTIALGQNRHVGFSTKAARLVVCTQATPLPDCSSLIELQPSIRAVLNREPLLAALARASVFTTEGDPVKLSLTTDQITLSVAGNTSGATSSETLSARYAGEPITLYFATSQLIDALRALPDDEVKLGYSGELKPVVLAPKSGGGTYRHVLMPRKG
jgi:DNA polymerase-3 subunit beta